MTGLRLLKGVIAIDPDSRAIDSYTHANDSYRHAIDFRSRANGFFRLSNESRCERNGAFGGEKCFCG